MQIDLRRLMIVLGVGTMIVNAGLLASCTPFVPLDKGIQYNSPMK